MDMYNLIIFWILKRLGTEVIERYINLSLKIRYISQFRRELTQDKQLRIVQLFSLLIVVIKIDQQDAFKYYSS